VVQIAWNDRVNTSSKTGKCRTNFGVGGTKSCQANAEQHAYEHPCWTILCC